MDTFFEAWAAQGRETLYRPVSPTPNQFLPNLEPEVRADIDEVAGVASGGGTTLLDLRSQAEFNGLPELDTRPGHIPGDVKLFDGSYLEWMGRDMPVVAGAGKIEG